MAIPTLVQSPHGVATSGSSVAVTLASTGAGNCLLIAVGVSSSSAARTVSSITLGSTGNTITKAKSQAVTGFDFDDGELWTDQGCSGGQTSLTVNFSGTVSAAAAVVMEWANILSTGAVDKTNSGTGSNSTSWSTGASGTLANTNEVVIGMSWADSTSAPGPVGPTSPWTNLASVAPSTDFALLVGYQVVSANTSLTYSGTETHAAYTCNVIASLIGTATTSFIAGKPVIVNQSVQRAAIW